MYFHYYTNYVVLNNMIFYEQKCEAKFVNKTNHYSEFENIDKINLFVSKSLK